MAGEVAATGGGAAPAGSSGTRTAGTTPGAATTTVSSPSTSPIGAGFSAAADARGTAISKDNDAAKEKVDNMWEYANNVQDSQDGGLGSILGIAGTVASVFL